MDNTPPPGDGRNGDLSGIDGGDLARLLEHNTFVLFHPGAQGSGTAEVGRFVEFLKQHGIRITEPRQRTVLVVEDDAARAEAMRGALEEHGYRAQVAHSAFEAAGAAETLRPDLMTLSHEMRGPGGIEVLRALRRKGRLDSTRVLWIAPPGAAVENALEAGARDVLRTPFAPAHLIDKINALARAG